MHSLSTRELAITLRKSGYAYSHISKQTGISKGTLSTWLCEIPYIPNAETTERVGKAISAANRRKTELKLENIKKIHELAAKDIGHLSGRDLFIFGLGLYLGEGSKTHDMTRIVNSDPDVIRVAMSWFYGLGVSRAQFNLRLHLYPDSDIEACLHFWSTATTIPVSQFGKVQIDTRTNKKRSGKGKLPYGTAHLTVRSGGRKEHGVELARKIQSWTAEVIRLNKNAGVV